MRIRIEEWRRRVLWRMICVMCGDSDVAGRDRLLLTRTGRRAGHNRRGWSLPGAHIGRTGLTLGLTLNREKTKLVKARQQRFDFLGYTFGPHCCKEGWPLVFGERRRRAWPSISSGHGSLGERTPTSPDGDSSGFNVRSPVPIRLVPFQALLDAVLMRSCRCPVQYAASF